jgi:REP element-mobilizing transposase RayT
MPQSFGSLHCHIVFSTKHRKPLIEPEWQDRLFEYIGGILRNHSCVLIAAGGTADHVHLLVSLSRTISVADAVRQIKSNSSGWVHGTLGLMEFQWQEGYGAFAVSYSNLDQVKAYIANQEEHHGRMTYQDEFRELLRRHQFEWDERYVWD